MRSVIVFVAALAIVMAFGVEAMLPAFDEIDAEFGFSERGLSVSLLVTSVLIGMGVGTLVWGPVSDRIGRRAALVTGLGIYVLGALLSALAPNLELVLLARAVWGFGAAAPGSLRYAIARDLYDGDRMARVVTIATAVFLIGPLLMPIVGEVILQFGPWEAIAVVGAVLGLVLAGWSIRFGETIPPAARRPLRFGPLLEAVGILARHRRAGGAIVASTCFFASFFIWLGSAQPIIDRIYDRDDDFIWFFATSGLAMSATLFVTNRLIRRVGTRRVALRASLAFVAVCTVGLVWSVGVGGLALGPWFGWVLLANSLGAVMSPVCAALALDPVGEIAGVTSAVLNFAALAIGGSLAALVDARIEDTVTPMIAGSFVFGLLGALTLWWSQAIPRQSSSSPRSTTASVSTPPSGSISNGR